MKKYIYKIRKDKRGPYVKLSKVFCRRYNIKKGDKVVFYMIKDGSCNYIRIGGRLMSMKVA